MRRLSFLLPVAVALLLLLFVLTRPAPPVETAGPVDSAAEPSVAERPPAPADRPDGRRPRKRAEPTTRVEPPADTARAPAVDPRDVFEIRVLGPVDTPVPGVRFVAGAAASVALGSGLPATTDASGRVLIPVPRDIERLEVESGQLTQGSLVLTERVTVIRETGFLPLDVSVVDAETGRPLGADVLLVADVGVAMFAPNAPDVKLASPSPGAYRLPLAPVKPGQKADLLFRVDPPPGYVSPARHVLERRGVLVSRYAERLRMTIPVRREAKLRVLVVDHDLDPAVGAAVRLAIGGRNVGPSDLKTGDDGAVAVRVPYLRGALVTATASAAGTGISATSPPVRFSSSAHETVLRVVLPEVPPETVIGIGGGVGGSMGLSGRIGSRKARTGPGRIDVLVRTRDGRPAAGARVYLVGRGSQRTNDGGMSSFVDLPGGAFRLELSEPGLVHTSKEVRLDRGETLSVELVEAFGRSVVVRVQNGQGTGLPYAMLTLHGGYEGRDLWLDDGVQRLDAFTNVDGNCILPRVSGQTLNIVGQYGVLRGSTQANTRGPVLLQIGH